MIIMIMMMMMMTMMIITITMIIIQLLLQQNRCHWTDTHRTFAAVHLIEVSPEYRFISLKSWEETFDVHTDQANHLIRTGCPLMLGKLPTQN